LEDRKSSALNENEKASDSTLEMLRKNSFVNQMNNNIEKQKQKIEEKEDHLTSKKDELIEASKSRKILDQLKKTDLEKYKLDQNRKEQNQLDEISANIALKKRRNNL
jgi:flagellar FliJ protein